MSKLLVCRHCWIPVSPMPEGKQYTRLDGSKGKLFKHNSPTDVHGLPSCGRVELIAKDVMWASEVHE